MLLFENNNENQPHYHVAVSQAYFSEKKPLKCILGSCVSVILFSQNPSCGFSSMSHYLLDRPIEHLLKDEDSDKYGSILISKQLDGMMEKVKHQDLRCMIFGGAEGNESFKARLISDIGSRNIKIAEELMMEKKIEVIAKNTGMQCSRFVEFHPKGKIALLKIMRQNETQFFSFKF